MVFFCAFERGCRRLSLATVPCKNWETLLPIINNTIDVGAHIRLEEWAAYANLNEEGYT